MHKLNSDLEWAAVQLADVSILLESLELPEIAATVRNAEQMLAALDAAIRESSIGERVLACG